MPRILPASQRIFFPIFFLFYAFQMFFFSFFFLFLFVHIAYVFIYIFVHYVENIKNDIKKEILLFIKNKILHIIYTMKRRSRQLFDNVFTAFKEIFFIVDTSAGFAGEFRIISFLLYWGIFFYFVNSPVGVFRRGCWCIWRKKRKKKKRKRKKKQREREKCYSDIIFFPLCFLYFFTTENSHFRFW